MKALVTGANGLVGSNLVRELSTQGHEVRGMVRRTSDLRSLAGLPVELVEGDVLDEGSLARAAAGCDVMFHTAAIFAYWGHRDAELERITVDGTRNAVAAARAASVRRVVLTSSSVVCGSNARPVERDETCGLDDRDPPFYYVAKARQEATARSLARRNGIELVAVCPTMSVGAHDYRLVPSNQVILRYLDDPFRVTFPGGCNIVHVQDVARGHVLAAEHGEPDGRYLLAGENLEWSLLHRIVAELCGVPAPALLATHTAAYLTACASEAAAWLTGRPPAATRAETKTLGRYYWYSHARASALGYAPRPARRALAEAIAWLLSSPHVSATLRSRLRPAREVLMHSPG
jgi:dihydroflavonol-4-reductase